MEFWEFNINFKQLWIIIGIIAVLFLISNVLRRKVGIIRKSLLPTAIIAGLLMLILKSLGLFELFNINRKEINDFFEAMTYHGLGFGVIAMTLKSTPKDKAKENKLMSLIVG